MGQTSHKQMRNDYLRNPHINAQTSSNSGYNPSMDFSYPSDEMIEDEDISIGPTIGARSPNSPTKNIPIFNFPNQNHTRNESANKKLPVVFKYSGKFAKDVYLIGTFTGWKEKLQMIKSDGDYMLIVELPEGEHQYKFVVDGKWEYDANQASIDDNFNGKNNIVTVRKTDFEVMDALEIDSIAPIGQKSNQSNDDLSKSPPGEYTDELPVRGLHSMSIDKPPYLPPQLLNIVLNKDTSARCEPALLPEPNHVMLKHLYALSIRDGVMVLSSTYRFKQKFVTTCFYKPI
ncbi:5 -AMP-activated kinase subunit beta-2 [Brachionus plicatilis]|uniref:5'-AMP-activated protein kinase subunit beta-1 n=1 Tax=Brachionus plicatilis TaxID=10195 RepID=A0A3M7PG73_BRAPC|nr:5 -AMP-activated kinase subunit beta-2 [Brachionus plicatilis]